ncbi:MAG TPA: hypothetical protein DDZ51_29445 [Planctomycetaceae bacterium]|nr:hypothetical protein [Planctomycetaceae bacterium]
MPEQKAQQSIRQRSDLSRNAVVSSRGNAGKDGFQSDNSVFDSRSRVGQKPGKTYPLGSTGDSGSRSGWKWICLTRC